MAILVLGVGLSPAGALCQAVTTLAGSGTAGSMEGIGTAASFNYPTGISADGSGNLYVADTDNHKIRKILPGAVVTTLAGAGTSGSQDGIGTAAKFDGPFGVAVDSAGNVFVADTGNNKIRKITPAAVVTTYAGSGAVGGDDGTGTAATFNGPAGVAVDSAGNVYVADAFGNKVRKIAPGAVVTTLAGSGSPGSDDGTGTEATFNSPYGVAVDAGGNVYVADMFNNKIRKITPAGVVTTLAGSGEIGSADGTGTGATFYLPSGVALDSTGSLFVADLGNRKIRKVTAGGIVTTYAGSGALGTTDGTGTAASFKSPSSLAADSAGTLYVTDYDAHNVRKITRLATACTPDAFTSCLIGGRYQVTSHWRNQYAGSQVQTLSAATLTDATAAFWLSDAAIYEYLIRINTATDNGRAWISIPTFTDVEFWIAVLDTRNGQYFEYHSPPGNRTMIYDPFFFVFP
jgi:sugar lactone lactonase YvrE